MNIGQLCNRRVVHIGKSDRVLDAARKMRHEHVGDLVVVEERDGRRVPVGVLTDRDIVVALVAEDVDITRLDVGDLLTRDVVTANEGEDLTDVLARMQQQGIRRMPVVDASGALAGIFTLDDLVSQLATELAAVGSLIRRERSREVEQRP